MKKRAVFRLIIIALVTYVSIQGIIQKVDDDITGGLRWTVVSVGEEIPGTNLRFLGTGSLKKTGYSVYTLIFKEGDEDPVDWGPIPVYTKLRPGVVYNGVVDTEANGVTGIYVGLPNGSYATRLTSRLLFQD